MRCACDLLVQAKALTSFVMTPYLLMPSRVFYYLAVNVTKL
jgi:hypothetical protein